MKETIKVEGMHCESCERRIENVLKDIEGVDNVIANHKKAIVEVTLKNQVSKDLLKEKIEDIGFEVKED